MSRSRLTSVSGCGFGTGVRGYLRKVVAKLQENKTGCAPEYIAKLIGNKYEAAFTNKGHLGGLFGKLSNELNVRTKGFEAFENSGIPFAEESEPVNRPHLQFLVISCRCEMHKGLINRCATNWAGFDDSFFGGVLE